jgi:quercetin dioxygenase-like cupin family protein
MSDIREEVAMKGTARILALVVAVVSGIVLGLVGTQALDAQQAPVTRTMLQQKNIEGIDGREFIMYMAEIIPGGVATKHFHPGPELAYVLQGTLILEPEGQPPMTLKAGESLHNPSKAVHSARNGSTTEPVKILVVLIGEKGQPLATPVP